MTDDERNAGGNAIDFTEEQRRRQLMKELEELGKEADEARHASTPDIDKVFFELEKAADRLFTLHFKMGCLDKYHPTGDPSVFNLQESVETANTLAKCVLAYLREARRISVS